MVMQIRKPLRYKSECEPVFEDVKRHFGNRLPPEWEDVVYAACYPQLLDVPDALFEQKRGADGKLELYENPGFSNFRKCFAREPDLAPEVFLYVRQRCARYNAGIKHKTKAKLVRAILLRSWRAELLKEMEPNGGYYYRHQTIEEVKQLRNGNPKRLKTKKVCELINKEIADWITHDYHRKVTEDDVEKALDTISESHPAKPPKK